VAKLFWNHTKVLSGVKIPHLNPLTWARDLLDPNLFLPKDAAVILCGMWSLWMARNDRRHDKVPLPVRIIVQWVVDTAFDLWQLVHPETNLKCLERPALGWTKCSVDAAFYDGDRSAATGVILRDSDGRTCGGTAKWYEHCMSALVAEAQACYDGLQFARDRGIRRICLETDCQVLVNLWVNRSHQNSEISPIIGKIEDLSRNFDSFSLCFISRTCNTLAHACVRLVSRASQVVEWPITPPGLMDIINRDCNPNHD
jgi:hypothetical protein